MDADMMDDALAQDVEGLGAESDDSDFDPEKQDNETKVQVEQWDDEENFVQPCSADLVSSEEEEPSLEKSNEVSKEKEVEASQATSEADVLDILKVKRMEQRKLAQ